MWTNSPVRVFSCHDLATDLMYQEFLVLALTKFKSFLYLLSPILRVFAICMGPLPINLMCCYTLSENSTGRNWYSNCISGLKEKPEIDFLPGFGTITKRPDSINRSNLFAEELSQPIALAMLLTSVNKGRTDVYTSRLMLCECRDAFVAWIWFDSCYIAERYKISMRETKYTCKPASKFSTWSSVLLLLRHGTSSN